MSSNCSILLSWIGSDPCLGAWEGIACGSSNSSVKRIRLNKCGGRVDFLHLPALLEAIAVSGGFFGAVDTKSLPRSLVSIDLKSNQFDGPLDLSSLPSGITYASFAQNRFGGTVDLGHLPHALGTLLLAENQFHGQVDLTTLPSSLTFLSLSGNSFAGSVDLLHLPPSLKQLLLNNNSFSGTIHISAAADALHILHVASNEFTNVVIDGNVSQPFRWFFQNNPWRCPLPAEPTWLANLLSSCVGDLMCSCVKRDVV